MMNRPQRARALQWPGQALALRARASRRKDGFQRLSARSAAPRGGPGRAGPPPGGGGGRGEPRRGPAGRASRRCQGPGGCQRARPAGVVICGDSLGTRGPGPEGPGRGGPYLPWARAPRAPPGARARGARAPGRTPAGRARPPAPRSPRSRRRRPRSPAASCPPRCAAPPAAGTAGRQEQARPGALTEPAPCPGGCAPATHTEGASASGARPPRVGGATQHFRRAGPIPTLFPPKADVPPTSESRSPLPREARPPAWASVAIGLWDARWSPVMLGSG